MYTQPLTGPWQFRQAGTDDWLPGQVPGGVHTDLLALGRIPDPFVADYEKRVQWVAESDWERLIRLHQGEEQEAHTLAVLLFAASARLRGWQAEVLPEVQGSARPDLAISKGDERLYVEVETGTRLHDGNAKWRMNAELNGGRAVIVARNVAERRVLIADCRNIAQHGAATDIETLIAVRFDEVNENTVMWTEEW